MKRDLALGVEGGFSNGLKDGFSKALAGNNFGLFGSNLKAQVGQAVLDGLEEAFIKGALLKNIIGPAIDNYLATGDTSAIDNAINQATAVSERFYNDVLRPVADRFGLVGTDSGSASAAPQAVQVSGPTVTSSINFDVLGTLSGVIATAAPLFSQAGRDVAAGGGAIVQGAGLFGAQIDRLDKILRSAETDWAALRR